MKLEVEVGKFRLLIFLSAERAKQKLEYERYTTAGFVGTPIRPTICRELSFKFGKVELDVET